MPRRINRQNEIITAEEIHSGQGFPFTPIVEPYDNATMFVDRELSTMNRTAWGHRIALLIGGMVGEGYLMYEKFAKNKTAFDDNAFFENALPRELKLLDKDVNRRRLGEDLRNFYYAREAPTLSNIEPCVDLLTDKFFWHGISVIVRARLASSDSAPTQLYHFDYSSKVLNTMQMLKCGKPVKYMVHAEDLLYQFRYPSLNDALPDDCAEVRLRQIYVGLFEFNCRI